MITSVCVCVCGGGVLQGEEEDRYHCHVHNQLHTHAAKSTSVKLSPLCAFFSIALAWHIALLTR